MMTLEQKNQIKATVPILKEHGVALSDYFYKRMLGNNPALKETFNLGHQRSGAQARALAGAILAYAEHIDNPHVLAPALELICHKHVSLNIQAPDYAIVGENLLHSISEVLHISMDDPLIAAWGAAYQQLADMLIAAERDLYNKQAQKAGGWLGWRRFKVDKKVPESREITSFYLVPEDNQPLPDYKAGQYISVRVHVAQLGHTQPRQYSLSSAPMGNCLRISVKREGPKVGLSDAGYVSSTLHDTVQEGDILEASAPTGNFFVLNPECDNVLISAGVGLTPLVAMLEQLAAGDPVTQGATAPRSISFIHAARNPDVHALRGEVAALAIKHRGIKTYTAYESVGDEFKIGKDFQRLGQLDLTAVPPEMLPPDADYYLCGPVPFMQQQNAALLGLGIPQSRIHAEAFATGGIPR